MKRIFTAIFSSILLHCSVLTAKEPVAPDVLHLEATESESVSNTLDFSNETLKISISPWLTATQGIIDITCRMPTNWPVADDMMLFHTQSKSHIHATLFFRNSSLYAVYKGGEKFFASVKLAESAIWKADSRHRIQFGWKPAKDDSGEDLSKDVEFVLLTDGKLAGSSHGRVMEPWPKHCEIGGRYNKDRWTGRMESITLSPTAIQLADVMPDLKAGKRTITVNGNEEIGPCYRFWTVANCNGPHRFLKPGHVEGKKRGQPFISQINAVYLLGGRYTDQNVWYKGLTDNGQLKVDFTGMIAQLKAMLDGGYTPWIDLGNAPYAMVKKPTQNTYGNTEPPDDEKVWARYVKAAIQAMIDAFGKDQVEGWWFRVGCEPDLNPGHWTGTKEQYFDHYDYTVAAVTELLPGTMIGPGNILNPRDGQYGTRTRGMWGLDIIDHAGAGTNAVTGKIGTRMDWFSCSWYARVGRPLSDFDESVNLMLNRLARYPQLKDTPLAIGEFTVLHDERGRRLWSGDTTEWAASFYAGMADRVYNYNIRQVYEWSQTTAGVYHPRTQVIAMLDSMEGGQRLETEVKAKSSADCGAISCRKGDDLYILLYNHRQLRRPSIPEEVNLVIKDKRMKKKQLWKLTESIIDAENASWAYEFAADCKKAGLKPLPEAGRYEGGVSFLYGTPGALLFKKNIAKYRKLSQPPETSEDVQVGRKVFKRKINMKGHSVRLLKLSPPSEVKNESGSFAWGIFDFLR